jgi:leucyl-tRNA synthetase
LSAVTASSDRDWLSALRNATEILIQTVAPMTPHLAEECWAALGNSNLVAEAGWPACEESLVVENEMTIPVQVNGKKRADLTISRDTAQSDIEAAVLLLEPVQTALAGKQPKKIIIVAQRIVNVVV